MAVAEAIRVVLAEAAEFVAVVAELEGAHDVLAGDAGGDSRAGSVGAEEDC